VDPFILETMGMFDSFLEICFSIFKKFKTKKWVIHFRFYFILYYIENWNAAFMFGILFFILFLQTSRLF